MTYTLHQEWTAKNYTPGPRPAPPVAIVIHWWGDPVGQTFAGIVDWFCNPHTTATTSAHFVASAGEVACIVNPDDIAWHAGDWNANLATIGIECNPRCSDADYQTISELIAYLRGIYGDLPLYPHRHFTQTTCPGSYDLARLDALSRTTTPEDTLPTAAEDITITAINGAKVSLADVVNSIDAKLTGLLSTELADPDAPGTSYPLADWIVWGATNAKHAAGNAATAAQRTDPTTLARTVHDAAANLVAGDLAAHLQVTAK